MIGIMKVSPRRRHRFIKPRSCIWQAAVVLYKHSVCIGYLLQSCIVLTLLCRESLAACSAYRMSLRPPTSAESLCAARCQNSLTVCAEPEQQGLDQQGLYVKGPKPYLCSYLANFVFICFVLSLFVFFCFYLSLFVFICFCLSFICNCLLLFYLGPGFVLYVYNTSPRPQSALV